MKILKTYKEESEVIKEKSICQVGGMAQMADMCPASLRPSVQTPVLQEKKCLPKLTSSTYKVSGCFIPHPL
jgi:hypothetical protein